MSYEIASKQQSIVLRGVEVHNLDAVDLDIPHGELVVFCGGQREREEQSCARHVVRGGAASITLKASRLIRVNSSNGWRSRTASGIDGIPPAIAVTNKSGGHSTRSTVGTATETADYLRLLFAKISKTFCLKCGQAVRKDTPQSVARRLERLPEGIRFMIAYPLTVPDETTLAESAARLREEGFLRLVVGEQMINLSTDGRAVGRGHTPGVGSDRPSEVGRSAGRADPRLGRDGVCQRRWTMPCVVGPFRCW